MWDHISGDTKPSNEGCYQENTLQRANISNFHTAQTIRGLEAHPKSKGTKPIPLSSTLQDGELEISTLYGSTKLALSKDIPQGCLLVCTSETPVSSPAPVQMEEERYQYITMPFGLNIAPSIFTRIMKHPIRMLTNISRRYTNRSQRLQHNQVAYPMDHLAAHCSRLHNKLGEVSTQPGSRNDLPGYSNQHRENGSRVTSTVFEQDSSRLPEITCYKEGYGSECCSFNRINDSFQNSDTACSSILQKSPIRPHKGNHTRFLRTTRILTRANQSRPPVVGQGKSLMEFRSDPPHEDQSGNKLGCVPARMGRGYRQGPSPWDLDSPKNSAPHKLTRITSSILQPENIRSPINKCISPNPHRQRHCDKVYQQEGRHSLATSVPGGHKPVEMGDGEKPEYSGRIYPGPREHDCGCAVSRGGSRLERLETISESIPRDYASLCDTASNRPVCQQNQHSAAYLCKLEEGPECMEDKCLHSRMGKSWDPLPLPAMDIGGKDPDEDNDRSSERGNPNCTSLANAYQSGSY